MEKVFATPKEGVLVRHETGKPLDAAGEAVERNSYWLRRERDGDVTLGPVPPAEPESPEVGSSEAPAPESVADPEPAPTKKKAKA